MTTKDLITYVILIVLFIFCIQQCTSNSNLKNSINEKDKALYALNDTIKLSIKNGIQEYTKAAPEIDIKDILNSNIYNTLTQDQQKFYTEISKLKGLVSASNAKLSAQDSILKTLALNNSQYNDLTDSTITFKRGSNIVFSDTNSNMKWSSNVIIDKNMSMNLNWNYKLNITTTFTRDKNKDLFVNYRIDDPKVKIVSIESIKVPNEIEGKTMVGKFLYKNRKTFRTIGATALFLGGGAVGIALTN